LEQLEDQKGMDVSPLPIIGLALIFAVEGRAVDQKLASLNLFFHRGLDTMHLQILVQEECYNSPPRER
jgi:hypothetical protein